MTILSTKKPGNEQFSKQILKGSDRVTRIVTISDRVFKNIKLKSVRKEITLYELLNAQLVEIINKKPTIELIEQTNARKRPVSIDKELFKKVKIFAVENDLKIQDILVFSLIKAATSCELA